MNDDMLLSARPECCKVQPVASRAHQEAKGKPRPSRATLPLPLPRDAKT
ncbi:MAG: hypothetical protein AW07_04158 [Candidatus Accumulibacter sp. SK-11]|nr:MAG: hypothetical protein AW07_04158 [Candidatus Accumulibacter sp. SK-11]